MRVRDYKVGDRVVEISSGRVGTVVKRDSNFETRRFIPDDCVVIRFDIESFYNDFFMYNWRSLSEIRKLTPLEKALR